MTKTVEINLDPVKSKLTGDEIKVGDEIVYVTMCTKTNYISRGKFLGTRVSKRTYTTRWGTPREITNVDIRYMVEQEDGRKTSLNYARMIPINAPVTALVGARL